MKDLFQYPEEQPEELKAILSKYEDQEQDYNTCKALLSEVQAIGYTFEFYLDAIPVDLRPIKKHSEKTIEAIAVLLNLPEHRVRELLTNEPLIEALAFDNAKEKLGSFKALQADAIRHLLTIDTTKEH